MTAVSVSIAQAVADALTAAELTVAGVVDEPLAACRSYADWELALTDARELHLDVVAVTTEQKSELQTRAPQIKYLVPVDIAVRYRLGPDKQDDDTGRLDIPTIDALVQLVETIHETFMPQRLTEFSAGVWVETKILVCPLLKHLRELRQFTGIVRVTFEAPKVLG